MAAQVKLFSKVTITDTEGAKNLFYIISSNSMLAKWIKHLVYTFNFYYRGSRTPLLMIGTLCPNLEQIDFDDDNKFYSALCRMIIAYREFRSLR